MHKSAFQSTGLCTSPDSVSFPTVSLCSDWGMANHPVARYQTPIFPSAAHTLSDTALRAWRLPLCIRSIPQTLDLPNLLSLRSASSIFWYIHTDFPSLLLGGFCWHWLILSFPFPSSQILRNPWMALPCFLPFFSCKSIFPYCISNIHPSFFSSWTLFFPAWRSLSLNLIFFPVVMFWALQQAVGLSAPSLRSCGLYSPIPNLHIGA